MGTFPRCRRSTRACPVVGVGAGTYYLRVAAVNGRSRPGLERSELEMPQEAPAPHRQPGPSHRWCSAGPCGSVGHRARRLGLSAELHRYVRRDSPTSPVTWRGDRAGRARSASIGDTDHSIRVRPGEAGPATAITVDGAPPPGPRRENPPGSAPAVAEQPGGRGQRWPPDSRTNSATRAQPSTGEIRIASYSNSSGELRGKTTLGPELEAR